MNLGENTARFPCDLNDSGRETDIRQDERRMNPARFYC
ncbi:hypothetical protein C427_2756 [Paraglaciecola psychrophila 170]|uniref:Uncharacterized protein n=1 Tax=Paraglaciecola psychrophila 170 TaxID=1129794 RepID=M4RMK6_9ALTE|nr:hypothetical protein C427_2756 [Paraglaciecola psychrophila 170]